MCVCVAKSGLASDEGKYAKMGGSQERKGHKDDRCYPNTRCFCVRLVLSDKGQM